MKKFLPILFLFLALNAKSADFIVAVVTVTNAPTTNGQTITVNSSTRTWTNSVVTASTQILTNSTIGGSATNLFNHLGTYGVGGIAVARNGTNGVKLYGYSPLTVSFSAGWGSVTYTTNASTNNYTVSVPFSIMGPTNRHIIGNLLIDDLNTYASTNQLNQNSNVTAQLVGLTNLQTIGGAKTFTNASTLIANGIISNATLTNIANLSGTLGRVTNGTFLNPKLTNGINYNNAFSSPGTNSGSEQFGASAVASGANSTALGNSATASGSTSVSVGFGTDATGDDSIAIGDTAQATAANAIAFGFETEASTNNAIAIGTSASATHINSVALGTEAVTTGSNQVVLGSSTVNHVYTPGRIEAVGGYTNANVKGSNTISGGLAFTRLNNTSLANGANAGIDVGTNASEKVYIKVSGPTAAFTLNGFASGRDGRILRIQNSTGYAMTIANDSGVDPVAANRIYTGVGTDLTYTNNPTILDFTYDSAVSKWILQTVTATASAGLVSGSFNGNQFAFTSTENIKSGALLTNITHYEQLNAQTNVVILGTNIINAFLMSPGAGASKVLVSDANGVGTWQPLAGGGFVLNTGQFEGGASSTNFKSGGLLTNIVHVNSLTNTNSAGFLAGTYAGAGTTNTNSFSFNGIRAFDWLTASNQIEVLNRSSNLLFKISQGGPVLYGGGGTNNSFTNVTLRGDSIMLGTEFSITFGSGSVIFNRTDGPNEIFAYDNASDTFRIQEKLLVTETITAQAGMNGIALTSVGLSVFTNRGVQTVIDSNLFMTGHGIFSNSLTIPNSAAPTVDADGEIALDTTITDHKPMLRYYNGSAEMLVPAILAADLTTTDGHVIVYDAANDKFKMAAQSGGAASIAGGVTNLFCQTNNVTVANTTSETTLKTTGTGSATIAANAIAQGTTVRVKASGYGSEPTGGGQVWTWKLKMGSTVVATGTTLAESFTDGGWDIDATISCRTSGASGSVVAGGAVAHPINSGFTHLVKTTATTIDTTATQAIDLTITFGNADASRTITCQQFTVDISHP